MSRSYPETSVGLIWRRFRRLRDDLDVIAFVGQTLTGDVFSEFVETVHRRLPRSIALGAVRDSALTLSGETLSSEALSRWLLLLSANIFRLRRGAVYPWSVQPSDQWAAAVVVEVQPTPPSGGDRNYVHIVYRILSGTAVGEILRKRASLAFVRMLARRLGFTSLRGGFPLQRPVELTGMQLMLHIVSGKHGGLDFDHVEVRPSQLSRNRRLVKTRRRMGFSCPLHLPVDFPCYRCPVGRDTCRAAVRPVTLVRKTCPFCGRPVWLDPRFPADACSRCALRAGAG